MASADPGGPDGADPAHRRRPVDLALFTLTLVVSAYVLFWPNPPGAEPFPYADKVVHAVIFLGVAWTGVRLGLPVRVLAVALITYAVGSELVQHTLLPGRSGDWTDVVADLAGAAVGVAGALARRRATEGAR